MRYAVSEEEVMVEITELGESNLIRSELITFP